MSALFFSVLASLIACEIYIYLPSLARRVVRYHASRLPEPFAERYREEWMADLDAVSGHFGKIIFALDLFRAVTQIVWNLAGQVGRMQVHARENEAESIERARQEKLAVARQVDRVYRRQMGVIVEYLDAVQTRSFEPPIVEKFNSRTDECQDELRGIFASLCATSNPPPGPHRER